MKNIQVSSIREFTLHGQVGTKGVRKLRGLGEVVRLCDYKKDPDNIDIVGDTLTCDGIVFSLDKIQSLSDIFQLFRDMEPRVGVVSDGVSLDDLLIAIYKHKGWPIEILDE